MKKPIFISYKRVDKEKVFEIKNFIEQRTGLSCWIDLIGIESDAQFEEVIIEAIDNCEVFLYFYSIEHTKIKNYESDWTIKEIDFAQEEGKRIVFINLDKTPLTKKFKFRYRQKQQVDAMDKSRLEKLVADLKKWFNKSSKTIESSLSKATESNHSQLAQYIKAIRIYHRHSCKKELLQLIQTDWNNEIGQVGIDYGKYKFFKLLTHFV